MKKLLLNPKLFAVTLVIASLFLLNTTGFAAIKTWAGGTGTGKNWTTGANWGGTAPVAGDDIVFNTAGVITFSTMPASVAYNSITISQGTVTIVGVNPAKTYTIGGNAGTDLTVALGATFSVGDPISITLATNATASIAGTLIVGATSVYNTNGTGVVTTVTGTITDNNTVTCATAAKLLFQSGSNYNIDQIGGVVPTATWDANSNCNVTLTAPPSGTGSWPTGTTQTFGNMSITTTGTGTNGWVIGNSITCAGDLTIANGSSRPAILTNGAGSLSITVGGDFTKSSGTLDLSSAGAGNGVLNVAGNFSNAAGAITENGTSTGSGIVCNGTLAQTFASAGTITNNVNLTINNAAGVTITNSFTLNAGLTLTNGILSIAAPNTLTIANGNVIGGSGFGAAKHINTQVSGATQGFLKVNNMAASTAYTFPVGNVGNYLPVIVTPTGTVANNIFTVGVFKGATQNGLPNGTPMTVKTNIVDAIYTVNYGGAGAPTAPATTLTLGWPVGLEGSNFISFTNPQIAIAHFDNPAWGDYIGSGNHAAFTATRTNVTTFSPFSVGKLGTAGATLPIKISYFNAAKGNGYNTLNWSAECSSDQVTFDIERSADGRNFTAINSITATRQQCLQPFNYVDNSILTGSVYYRIKIIDMNGKISYTSVVRLANQSTDMQLVGVLPNPVSNTAVLNIVSAKKDNVQLWVVSMEGKLVQRSTVQLQPGSSIINLDVTNLQAGMYTIKGTFGDGQTSSVKFVKQ